MLETITSDSPLRGLSEELRRQLASKRDVVADTRLVSFSVPDAAWDGERASDAPPAVPMELLIDMPGEEGSAAFGVTRHAHGQIADHLGVPFKFYERLRGGHADLFAHLANGLFAQAPSKRLVRLLDGQVRAVLSDRYRVRDNLDLLEQAILPELSLFPGPTSFLRCELTETNLFIKIGLPGFEKPVTPKVGDVIEGGVLVKNSEVGAGALLVCPYTTRLSCRNGMVHMDLGQRRIHVGRRATGSGEEEAWDLYSDETLRLDDAAFFAKCRDTLRAVLTETVFDRIVDQMRELAQIRPTSAPDKTIEVLADRHGLNEGERGSMLAALIEDGDLSAWGLVNSITQTARDLDDIERQVELESLAGRLTSDPAWAHALAV